MLRYFLSLAILLMLGSYTLAYQPGLDQYVVGVDSYTSYSVDLFEVAIVHTASETTYNATSPTWQYLTDQESGRYRSGMIGVVSNRNLLKLSEEVLQPWQDIKPTMSLMAT